MGRVAQASLAALDFLSPLFWTHVAPYGEVRLNMSRRLTLRGASGSSRGLSLTTGVPESF
jgi:hypothetical protein